jgi:hypothetical protein
MTYRQRRLRAGTLLAVVAAIAMVLGVRSAASLPSPAAPSSDAPRTHHAGQGEAAGAVPDGTTVFDDDVPGVARLDPDLRRALRRAASDAAEEGVELVVDSGWRSRAYQARLLREAVAKYGSAAEAARWVATPGTSAHVSGDAVDLGSSGAAWLSEHGAAYGLCQVYVNEPWHFELRSGGCPPMYADPTQDPRLRGGSARTGTPRAAPVRLL